MVRRIAAAGTQASAALNITVPHKLLRRNKYTAAHKRGTQLPLAILVVFWLSSLACSVKVAICCFT